MFSNLNFGLDMKGINKVTDNTVTLFKTRIEKALQWLLDIGKAVSIVVTVEKDLTNINRINYKVDSIQADGIPIVVNNFVTVGGPSAGFSFP